MVPMSDSKVQKVERALDELAAKSSPEGGEKVDRQFAAKLARLEDDDDAPEEMVRQLRVLWAMMKDTKAKLPWKQKALIMAGLSYFVSPFDIVPDVLGSKGYLDDALVIRIVYRRLGEAVKPYEAASEPSPAS